MVIAIDGPAGAGKSTVARALAERLGFEYLNSGAMYRAVALASIESGIDLDDPDAVADRALSMELVLEGHGKGRYVVLLDGDDISDQIKEPEISRASSKISRHPKVREELVRRQREILARGDYVAEGRDIGTVVAPDAQLKVFLTADEATRASRRVAELSALGVDSAREQVLEAISKRDRADSTREASPLMEADDSVVIDTSELSVDQVIEKIVPLIEPKGL